MDKTRKRAEKQYAEGQGAQGDASQRPKNSSASGEEGGTGALTIAPSVRSRKPPKARPALRPAEITIAPSYNAIMYGAVTTFLQRYCIQLTYSVGIPYTDVLHT